MRCWRGGRAGNVECPWLGRRGTRLLPRHDVADHVRRCAASPRRGLGVLWRASGRSAGRDRVVWSGRAEGRAVFGASDLLQPTAKGAALCEQYLTEAGNEDFQIAVISGMGHGIQLSDLAYEKALPEWSAQPYSGSGGLCFRWLSTWCPDGESVVPMPADGLQQPPTLRARESAAAGVFAFAGWRGGSHRRRCREAHTAG